MTRFGVSETKASALRKKMRRLGVREADLEERFVRAQGPGGQNVNKVSTCVWLRHTPSKITVKVQQERSQALNRFLARKLLTDRLETKVLGARSAERKRIEKIRRQKRKRSRRAKEKMLADKKYRSRTKQLRTRPASDEE